MFRSSFHSFVCALAVGAALVAIPTPALANTYELRSDSLDVWAGYSNNNPRSGSSPGVGTYAYSIAHATSTEGGSTTYTYSLDTSFGGRITPSTSRLQGTLGTGTASKSSSTALVESLTARGITITGPSYYSFTDTGIDGSLSGSSSSSFNGSSVSYPDLFWSDTTYGGQTYLCIELRSSTVMVPKDASFSFVAPMRFYYSPTEFARAFTGAVSDVKVYASTGSVDSVVECPLSNGGYTCPVNAKLLCYYIRLATKPPSGTNGLYFFQPSVYVDTNSVVNAIEYQTDTLMDTSGSSGISVGNIGNQVSGAMNGVNDALDIGSDFMQGITTEEHGPFSLPSFSLNVAGTSWDFQGGSVDIWQTFPDLETPVRSFVTFVLIGAWAKGVHDWYLVNFQGGTRVVVEDDSSGGDLF